MGLSFPSFFLTKKKFAAYGLQDSRMVPLFRCSWTKLWTSWISFWLRGRSRPGIVDGAPGSSSMAWSQIVYFRSRWDCSSLNTLLCWAYSGGIFVLSDSCVVPIVALHSKILSAWMVRGLLMVRGRNRAFAVSEVLNTIGRCVWSIHPLLQSILGFTATNHGYPKIALCSPSCVRKNLMFVVVKPVRMARSV